MHIDNFGMRRWLQSAWKAPSNRIELTREEQIRIFTRLTDAVTFEEFIRKKFVGAKSFSLEGCESLIPLLDLAIEKAAEQGIQEIVLGMAHRGRLNVLANILGKSPRQIFREFADDPKAFAATATSNTTLATATTGRRPGQASICPFASIPATSSLSIRSRWAACASSRTAGRRPTARLPARKAGRTTAPAWRC